MDVMTINDMLREQIAELHKLLELKNKRIAELEVMLAAPRPIITLPQVNLPFMQQPMLPQPQWVVTCDSTDPMNATGTVWFDKAGKVINK
jgi:hypothetical protein